MMAIDSKQLNNGDEVLGDRSVDKALRQRAANRMQELYLAMASGAAGWEAGDAPRSLWFVLAVTNRSEKDVEKALLDAGVVAWLPMKWGDRKRRGCRPVATRKAVLLPVIPGYVFVSAIPRAESWEGLLNVKFVSGILGDRHGRPIPISEQDINRLKKLADEGEFDQTVEARRLNKGDRVTIKDGPFAWYEGDVAWIEEARKGYVGTLHVRVMVAIFGRVTPVTLDLAQISKLE